MSLKRCTKCKIEKDLSCFSTDNRKSDKKCVRCKDCRHIAYVNSKDEVALASKKWREENLDHFKKKSSEYYYNNREAVLAKMSERYFSDKEKISLRIKRYIDNNPGFIARKQAKRRACELRATPIWADMEKIAEMYEMSAILTKETGIPHHVDHIFPLQGKDVCGLHVHTNLRVITAEENIRKSNKMPSKAELAPCPNSHTFKITRMK